jgi:enoyl-CoA hydratase
VTTPRDVILCERRGRAAYITLNRPEALNAITLAMVDALDDNLAEIARDDTLCAVVIAGSPRAFSALARSRIA